MKKRNHIQKLPYAVKASGLGVFLVAGLNGCDGQDDCNKQWQGSKTYMNQTKECEESRSHGHGATIIPASTGASTSSSSSTKSGYFGSSSSSNYSSGG